MIEAGTVEKINLASGDWIILDIGFAKTGNQSCGLQITAEEPEPRVFTFNDAVTKICAFCASAENPINLLIEAPLSVAFDENGNPIGRSMERRGKQIRYWYMGGGCVVMVAALYLIRRLHENKNNKSIRLFEGFVSFRLRRENTDTFIQRENAHIEDVKMLRAIVDNKHDGKVYSNDDPNTDDITKNKTDELQSAFKVADMDCGIPLVIMPKPPA